MVRRGHRLNSRKVQFSKQSIPLRELNVGLQGQPESTPTHQAGSPLIGNPMRTASLLITSNSKKRPPSRSICLTLVTISSNSSVACSTLAANNQIVRARFKALGCRQSLHVEEFELNVIRNLFESLYRSFEKNALEIPVEVYRENAFQIRGRTTRVVPLVPAPAVQEVNKSSSLLDLVPLFGNRAC